MINVLSFLKTMSTEDDANSVFCPVRVMALAAGAGLILWTTYQLVQDPHTFDIEKVGRALMEYFGGVGAAIFGKAKGTGA